MKIARERIAKEAEEKTGFLDLGRLGLTELPDELGDLVHLKNLNLGSWYDRDDEFLNASGDIGRNKFSTNTLINLAKLTVLEVLQLQDTHVSDLSPLSGLPSLKFLFLNYSLVTDLTGLSALPALEGVRLARTGVSDLTPLSGLPSLKTLNLNYSQVTDLAGLRDLPALEEVHLAGIGVLDLTSLSGLSTLKHLDLDNSQVTDLAGLRDLSALEEVRLAGTGVSDLTSLSGLSTLKYLDLDNSQVTDLAGLRDLSALEEVRLAGTGVSDLTPLSGLPSLKILNLDNSQVTDLAGLRDLSALEEVRLAGAGVSDLTPLSGLPSLKILNLDDSQVTDLAGLSDLPALEEVHLDHCKIAVVPNGFWEKDSLHTVHACNTRIQGLPDEVLSDSYSENCLPGIRAHLADLASGGADFADLKLMVLGNGLVGKTQICRRLRGQGFDPKIESTHGINVSSAPLPGADAGQFNIWDFGGQDIYHGTHALFMQNRAIFIIAWNPAAEDQREHEHGGMTFRNQTLEYWLQYVRRLGGADSPVIIVQTQCDDPAVEALPKLPPDWRDGLGFARVTQCSAATAVGMERLQLELKQAVTYFRQKNPVVQIGAGRAEVLRKLQEWRDEDASLPIRRRQHRTLSQNAFRQLCEDSGGVAAPEFLLQFLHNAGVVFYQKGLFEDQVILDQEWALEAIYAVFHRGKCYRILEGMGGRFNRTLLGELLWNEAGFGEDEQKLFISMMQTCGICFTHDPWHAEDPNYIAPDLLPESPILDGWDDQADANEQTLTWRLLPKSLIRELIASIGERAGLQARYWRHGVNAWEATTASRVIVEQTAFDDDGSGAIEVRTQGRGATELLGRIVERVLEIARRLGLEPNEAMQDDPRGSSELETQKDLEFTSEPAGWPRYYVSYAWKDETDPKREEAVERLCEAAEAKQIHILRDTDQIEMGESIQRFMDSLVTGDQVCVVLSEKYLKSPNCMYELYRLWVHCRQGKEELRQRVVLLTLDDATIWTILERLRWAGYWDTQFRELSTVVDDIGAHLLGKSDFNRFQLMRQFSSHIGEILETFADTLQPRTIDDFIDHALGRMAGG